MIRVRWQVGPKGKRVSRVAYGMIMYDQELKVKWKWVGKVMECVGQGKRGVPHE